MATLSQEIYSDQNDVRLTQILEVIASAEQCDTHDLPPLYDAIDPDMLMDLLDGAGIVEVSFQYLDYTITINNEGRDTVTLTEA